MNALRTIILKPQCVTGLAGRHRRQSYHGRVLATCWLWDGVPKLFCRLYLELNGTIDARNC